MDKDKRDVLLAIVALAVILAGFVLTGTQDREDWQRAQRASVEALA